MTPFGLSPDDMLRAARCASFMQSKKMELWNASEQHVLPSEAELDAIAGRLFDTFYKEMPMNPDIAEFVAYCEQNPEQRLWQALRNFFGYDFIYGQKAGEPLEDTFYKE